MAAMHASRGLGRAGRVARSLGAASTCRGARESAGPGPVRGWARVGCSALRSNDHGSPASRRRPAHIPDQSNRANHRHLAATAPVTAFVPGEIPHAYRGAWPRRPG